MKNHFLISYPGNKRQEVENIYKYVKESLETVDTIIEPFCGFSAFSFYVSTLHLLKYKYILNDLDKNILVIYKICKYEIEFNKFIEEIFEITENLDKEKYNTIIKTEGLHGWFIAHKIHALRAGMFPLNYTPYDFNKIKKCPILHFLRTENIEFSNINGVDLLEKHKDDKNVFMFIDPPI